MAYIYITTADLKGACSEHVELFNATFNGKAKITSRNIARAIAAGLDVWWLERLIPAAARAEYDKVTAAARAEYDKVRAPARAEYDKVRAAAWAEYDKVRAAAWAEYDKVRAAAWAEYDKVRAPARAEYDKVRAKALIAALTVAVERKAEAA